MDVSAAQRAYRALMRCVFFPDWFETVSNHAQAATCCRKLHPDRVGQSEDVAKAVEKVREASNSKLSRTNRLTVSLLLRKSMVCVYITIYIVRRVVE